MATARAKDPALDAITLELADELERRADEAAARVFKAMRGSLTGWMYEPPLGEELVKYMRESWLRSVEALRIGELPEELAPADAWGAEQSAQMGSDLTLLLDGYQHAHETFWNVWSELIDAAELEPDLAQAVRRRGSEFFFAYERRITALVTERYMRERDRRHLGSGERRLSELRALLEGETDEVDPQVVDYPFHGSHVAIVGKGQSLKDAVRGIAADLDCRHLVIDVYPDPWWAWLGRSRSLPDRTADTVRELCDAEGALAGIGRPRPGVDGFRQTTREALAAFRAAHRGRPVVTYRDVALEDLASRDAEAARGFIREELAALGDPGVRAERLRETLAAYFECGQNARATAARLGIHHQTVAQRLAAIEERIGQRVAARRAELELALRLDRYLTAAPPASHSS